MTRKTPLRCMTFLFLCMTAGALQASAPMDENQVANVKKVAAVTEEDKMRLQKTAGYLANYEIEASKLLKQLEDSTSTDRSMVQQNKVLLDLSEQIIASARFRLPQCEEYLSKSLLLKDILADITHERLEEDYHHDKALPEAPVECYHTKDLFVHPATVVVLLRDDPAASPATRDSINAEITEVLAHLELVRQLVIYN